MTLLHSWGVGGGLDTEIMTLLHSWGVDTDIMTLLHSCREEGVDRHHDTASQVGGGREGVDTNIGTLQTAGGEGGG